uniref:envelope stress sensor histidine kinase CpxA n=1 Tax=Thaumasiovibrio occultus TaxID=1891184 RepID=UPI000B34B122|nr:envelope stress sensor histidine kinase CpxA [Thaumasiovibrio occultus]
MNLPRVSSLYGRIFAIFWLTLLIVVFGLLLMPKLDPRASQNIPKHQLAEITRGLNSAAAPSTELLGKINQLRGQLDHEGRFRLFFSYPDGTPIGDWSHVGRVLRNFTSLSFDPEKPQQRLYGQMMISGPFLIEADDGRGYVYIVRRGHKPPPWFIQLLDSPVQLLLITMLVSTPFLLWLAWIVTQPARRLQSAAEQVARGELKRNPTLELGPSEFSQTGRSFNHMVDALNTMISGQQRLLSDISHELRSPLTRLRMATALAKRKQGESSELQRIETEAERLEAMITELLELSRMQTGSQAEYQTLDASELWLDMLKDAHFEADTNHKQLCWNTIPAATLHCHPSLLCSALENVVRNAIKYAHHEVKVEFTLRDEQLCITVNDDGPGVPESECAEIFRPFYRVSTARDRESGGTGLGLSITQNAINRHHGSVNAALNTLGGLQINIALPLVP